MKTTNRKPLRPLLLAFSAFLFAGSAAAEWIQLGRTENFRIYLEQKQILRKGDRAQIWQLMDFTAAQWADPPWERIEAGGPPDRIRQVACGGKEK